MPTVPVEPRNPRKPSSVMKVRAVEIVVSDAHVHAHEAVARRASLETSAPNCATIGALVQIEQAVLDVVGRRFARARQRQFESRASAVEFILHGRERVVGIAAAALLRLRQRAAAMARRSRAGGRPRGIRNSGRNNGSASASMIERSECLIRAVH